MHIKCVIVKITCANVWKGFPCNYKIASRGQPRALTQFALVLGLLTDNMQVSTSKCASCSWYSFVDRSSGNTFFSDLVRSSTMNRSLAKICINNGLELEMKMRDLAIWQVMQFRCLGFNVKSIRDRDVNHQVGQMKLSDLGVICDVKVLPKRKISTYSHSANSALRYLLLRSVNKSVNKVL